MRNYLCKIISIKVLQKILFSRMRSQRHPNLENLEREGSDLEEDSEYGLNDLATVRTGPILGRGGSFLNSDDSDFEGDQISSSQRGNFDLKIIIIRLL